MSILTEKELNRNNLKLHKKPPIKVVQFGEGNFLRAFVDFAFQELNKVVDFDAGVAVVQPIEKGLVEILNNQDGLYTLFLKGIRNGESIQTKELITNIVKGINPYTHFEEFLELAREEQLQFVISNTTEAGIVFEETDLQEMRPPSSFPAKLALLLYARFKYFNGASNKGLTIIPCELINYNAQTLKEIIINYTSIWNLEDNFKNWLLNSCTFHNTLVDRIVPGYPKDEIDIYKAQINYEDKLIITAETFFLWVIEGDEKLKQQLPFHKTNLNVKIVKDLQPYRTRKVRILNGAHTAMVPFSLLYGHETVKATIDDEFTGEFVRHVIFDEINETLPLDKAELDTFAEEVLDRFRNPFIRHQLADIALNSISKFKVRVLPSLIEYNIKKGKLPLHLCFALACLIRFYKGTWNDKVLPVNDSDDIVLEFQTIWSSNNFHEIATNSLKNKKFWDQDLSKINNLTSAIIFALEQIETNNLKQAFKSFKEKF
jgi:tagaturonate reductase